MYGVEEKADSEPREFYRCPVDSDKAAAKIKVGRKTVRASVVEKSIDCYTVLVRKSAARKLTEGKHCRLNFDGTVVEVVVQRKSKPEDGYVRMGLIQVRDLTKPEKVKASWWPTKRPISGTDNTASVVFGGFVLVLFCGMALPGLGDRLGTSDRIQNAFRWCLTSASSQLDDWTR